MWSIWNLWTELSKFESLILCHKKPNHICGWAFYIVVVRDSNPSKCNNPVDCCSCPDRRA